MKMHDVYQKIPYLLALTAFAVCVWFDLSWADIDILQAKAIDEFAFHGSLLRMYEGVVHLDVKQLFSFGFYSYGFPFFLVNLLATIPYLHETGHPFAIIIPRVLTSFFLFFSLIMVIKTLKLERQSTASITIALLIILLMPGVWHNATWFHPDYMMTALLLLSVLWLRKSEFQENRYYWFAVLAWGMAIAIKFQAITAAMCFVWIYLGWISQHRSISSLLITFTKTVGGLVLVFILMNPYVIHPNGLQAWVSSFIQNMQSNATDHGSGQVLSLAFKMEKAVFDYYFPLPLYVLVVLSAMYLSLRDIVAKSFGFGGMLAIYVLANGVYNLFFINKGWNHYYLPVAFVAVLVMILAFSSILMHALRVNTPKPAILVALVGVLVVQVFAFDDNVARLLIDRSHGRVSTADSHYVRKIVNEAEEKRKVIEVEKLLEGISVSKSVFLISPYLNFPFRGTSDSYSNVRVIYGPLTQDTIDLAVNVCGKLDYIILRKNDLYFDDHEMSIRTDAKKYMQASNMIAGWHAGHGQFKLIKSNDCCYLFGFKGGDD